MRLPTAEIAYEADSQKLKSVDLDILLGTVLIINHKYTI